MPFTRKTTRTYRPETFYRHFNDARALQTYTHDAHARKTHTKRTRNQHHDRWRHTAITSGSQPALFSDQPHRPMGHPSSQTNIALFTATIFPISTPTRTVRRPSPPQPALFAEVRTLPIFQHFSSKSLSFNMTDLAQKVWTLPIFQHFFFKIPIF